MRLATILEKYTDDESIRDFQTALEFIDDLLKKISPLDYGEILRLFTEKSLKELSDTQSNDQLLGILISGLEKNKILELLQTKKLIGL